MQIRDLHRALYRGARLASRLDAPERSGEAARRDAVARWQQARRDGLTADTAAKAVGTSWASLYRWQRRLTWRSTRPHTVRAVKLEPELTLAIEHLRKRYPMWGKDKRAPMVWKQGFTCSVSKVGRILKRLVARAVVAAVPNLRKGSNQAPREYKRVYAQRLPRHLKPERPGEIVQVDTVHVGLMPGKTIRHFTGYCPVANWTVGKAYNQATAESATLLTTNPGEPAPLSKGLNADMDLTPTPPRRTVASRSLPYLK